MAPQPSCAVSALSGDVPEQPELGPPCSSALLDAPHDIRRGIERVLRASGAPRSRRVLGARCPEFAGFGRVVYCAPAARCSRTRCGVPVRVAAPRCAGSIRATRPNFKSLTRKSFNLHRPPTNPLPINRLRRIRRVSVFAPQFMSKKAIWTRFPLARCHNQLVFCDL